MCVTYAAIGAHRVAASPPVKSVMQRRVCLAACAVAHCAALLLFAAPAAGQVASPPFVAAPTELEGLFSRGDQLESNRRWGEALTLYEDALRLHPGEKQVEKRYLISKIHYELGRRYSDSSFKQALRTLPEQDALNLYGEVLLKIQSHYVDPPDWAQLVRRGCECLEVALADPAFGDKHLNRVARQNVDRFRQELRGQMAARNIRSREDCREAARGFARLAASRLGLPGTAVMFEYLCGATLALDDYSTYLTGDQLDEVYSQIDGNFVGLGIELKASNGALLIVKVIPGSPAEQGGIRPGDRIVAVDGRSTADLNTDQAADMLQGEEGSLVEVSAVSAEGQSRTLRLRREQVEVPSVDDVKIADPEFGIAYLKLTCFQKTTTKDLDAALWKLQRQGMRSLVMDLRGNPGGLLTSSVEVADKFVDEGLIVTTRGRNPSEDYRYSAHRAGTWRVPLVVLIDGDSASASEIFAGAIRDHHRGTIVGARSYGKGSVQGIFPLNQANSGIRLTTAKFYSPLGRPYSKQGVDPDIAVHEAAKPVSVSSTADFQLPPTAENDTVLSRALQVARQQLARR